MENTLINIITFVIPCWITNMSFQFIWAFKKLIPNNHPLKILKKIDSFDFIFFDKKYFIGSGLRITSIVPILLLPFFFNLFLPLELSYYFKITFLVFIGDLLGSIVKRRLGFKKGQFALFIDHGDYIITTGLVFIFLKYISMEVFIYSLLLTYILHPIVCYIGYKLKIKEQPL